MAISVIRTLILYIVILVMVRLMGKRQISDLQTSELVVTLLISNIAVIPMQDTSLPLLSGVVPIMLLVACEIAISFIMLKNNKIRQLICGKPQIVIFNGVVDQKKMRELRISIEDLSEQLRQEGVFALSDVKYAIVETNGKISVMKKPLKDSVTAEQMKIPSPTADFEAVVINDGEFSQNSMKFCGVTEEWLRKTLKRNNTDIKDVFIMTATADHKYNIVKKEN